MFDAGIGIDSPINGNVNSGAIGFIGTDAAAILPNTYGDVYGTGIQFRFGGGYMLNDLTEVRGVFIFQSADADLVRLGDVGARVTFHDASDDPVSIGSATVRAGNVAHQGPTVGYRIEEGTRSLAYLPDHEPSLGVELDDLPPSWISGHAVAHDVDVLFHDAQYGDHEYPQHVGWGHSAFEHVFRFAQKAPIPTVPVGALIGRVGNGQPFPIGDTTQAFDMPDNGRLFLGVNDDHVADNSGNFVVKIWEQ